MNNLKQGTFITFEGGEGIGKSTQCQMLYEYLKSQNIPVILTREVGGTAVAEKMREILVHEELLPMSELLQVMAARYDHIHKKILPSLQEGYTVICDRFIDSTACYQGQYSEIGVNLVYDLHKSLMAGLMPNSTFFIDVKPEIAIERMTKRDFNNKFDKRHLDFHQNIYNGFKELAQKFPERIITIDASNLDTQAIHEMIINNLVNLKSCHTVA
ncbi:dTMP kinase [Rickettsia endosymbiont of Ceutorhynchus obstrictus]|uniref:dTMP kinase n=1 Tax=Rickettsia endosymbiont of Ceutorhynchus obstrictus TaxID=3066249 RepID=UPI0031332B24